MAFVSTIVLAHRNDDHEGHKVKPALVKTLKDLGLDYIDLFLVHFHLEPQQCFLLLLRVYPQLAYVDGFHYHRRLSLLATAGPLAIHRPKHQGADTTLQGDMASNGEACR